MRLYKPSISFAYYLDDRYDPIMLSAVKNYNDAIKSGNDTNSDDIQTLLIHRLSDNWISLSEYNDLMHELAQAEKKHFAINLTIGGFLDDEDTDN